MARTVKEQIGVDLPEPEAPEQTPEVEETPERPEWLPEKFKDENEFAISYKNLEDELRRRGEEQKGLEGQLNDLRDLIETQQQPSQQQQGDVNEQLMAAYDNDPIGTIVFLANQVAEQRFQNFQTQNQPQLAQQQQLQGELIATNAERIMEAKFDDWHEYGPKVGEMIEKNPNLLPSDALLSLDRTTDALEMIYKQAKYDDLVAQIENGNADQSKMKAQAQTISGMVGRPGQPSDTDEKMDRLLAAAKNASYSAWRGSS